MLVAAGQFAVTSIWEKNAEICASLMAQAAENDVSLFVLPEALLRATILTRICQLNRHSCWKGNSSDVYCGKVNVT